MDDERIDFSALDPSNHPRRWAALVQRTVDASIIAPPSAWGSLVRLRGAVLGLAALALLSWVPALTRDVQPSEEQTADPAFALMQYSHAGDMTALLETTNGY